jgi:DNA-binding GntR family transcriptional regulator
LATDGLIDHVPRRGAFVADISEGDILDHFACFGLLSAYSASRAVTRLADQEIDELERLAARIDSGNDPVQREQDNDPFHRIINRAEVQQAAGITEERLSESQR